MTSVGADLDEATMNALTSFLKDNADIFAWMLDDMLGIDPNLLCLKLALNLLVKPVYQRRRKMTPEWLEDFER